MRAARFGGFARDTLPPSFDTADATKAGFERRRRKAASELVPADDFESYSGRRRRTNAWSRFRA
jgi:hypothetical protein